MKAEASLAGLYENPLMDRHYPRIQIVTIEELLAGKRPLLPHRVQGPSAPRVGQQVQQGSLID